MINSVHHQLDVLKNSLDLAGMDAPERRKKNKNLAVVLFVTALLLTAGCAQQDSGQTTAQQGSEQLTEEGKDAMADTMRSFVVDMNESFERLDTESYMDYFSQDSRYVYQGSALSHKELQTLIENSMDGLQKASIDTVGSADVKVLSRDDAVILFNYEFTTVDSKGDTTELGGIISAVVSREDDGWKVVHAHETLEN